MTKEKQTGNLSTTLTRAITNAIPENNQLRKDRSSIIDAAVTVDKEQILSAITASDSIQNQLAVEAVTVTKSEYLSMHCRKTGQFIRSIAPYEFTQCAQLFGTSPTLLSLSDTWHLHTATEWLDTSPARLNTLSLAQPVNYCVYLLGLMFHSGNEQFESVSSAVEVNPSSSAMTSIASDTKASTTVGVPTTTKQSDTISYLSANTQQTFLREKITANTNISELLSTSDGKYAVIELNTLLSRCYGIIDPSHLLTARHIFNGLTITNATTSIQALTKLTAAVKSLIRYATDKHITAKIKKNEAKFASVVDVQELAAKCNGLSAFRHTAVGGAKAHSFTSDILNLLTTFVNDVGFLKQAEISKSTNKFKLNIQKAAIVDSLTAQAQAELESGDASSINTSAPEKLLAQSPKDSVTFRTSSRSSNALQSQTTATKIKPLTLADRIRAKRETKS